MQNEIDTLPFTNQFNYLVKEISVEEFLAALSHFESGDEVTNNEQTNSEIGGDL